MNEIEAMQKAVRESIHDTNVLLVHEQLTVDKEGYHDIQIILLEAETKLKAAAAKYAERRKQRTQ